jgi:predicted nucleic acid-binding protein
VTGYLLDTNIVSELRKTRPHGAVVAWVKRLREDQIYLAAVTLGELQAGVEQTRRSDTAKAAEIEAWIGQMATSLRVIPMDTACFREWARLTHGKPEQIFEDAMIAATARIHNLIVATRNMRDFRNLGVELVNPFEAAA